MKKFYQCDVAESDSDSIWTSSVIYSDSLEEAEFRVMLELQQDWGDSYMPDAFIDAFGEERRDGCDPDPEFPGVEAWKREGYWTDIPVTTGMLEVPAVEALAQLGKIEAPSPEIVETLMSGAAKAQLTVGPVRIILSMEGGIVQGGWSEAPVDVTIFDYDTEGADAERVVDVHQDNGSDTAEAYIGGVDVEVNPAFVASAVPAVIERVRRQENNLCRLCACDLDAPSAAGAEDGVCGPCIAGEDEEGSGNE